MKFVCVAISALIALVPMASYVLIAVEVVMVYQIAKSHGAFNLSDLFWFCSKMVVISLFGCNSKLFAVRNDPNRQRAYRRNFIFKT